MLVLKCFHGICGELLCRQAKMIFLRWWQHTRQTSYIMTFHGENIVDVNTNNLHIFCRTCRRNCLIANINLNVTQQQLSLDAAPSDRRSLPRQRCGASALGGQRQRQRKRERLTNIDKTNHCLVVANGVVFQDRFYCKHFTLSFLVGLSVLANMYIQHAKYLAKQRYQNQTFWLLYMS